MGVARLSYNFRPPQAWSHIKTTQVARNAFHRAQIIANVWCYGPRVPMLPAKEV